MAKITISLALVLIVTVSTTSLDFNQLPQRVEAFKEELEKEIKDNKVTCETYKDICALGVEKNSDPNSACQITLRSYLCDKLQDLKGVEEILARVKQAHPDAMDDDEDEYEDSGEATEIEYD